MSCGTDSPQNPCADCRLTALDPRDRHAGAESRRGRQRAQPPPRRGRAHHGRRGRHARLDAGRLDGPRADDHPGRGPQRGLPRLLPPARQPHVEAAPRLHLRRRGERRPRLPGKPVSRPRSASCASSTAAARRTPGSCAASGPPSPTSRPTRRATRSSAPTFALRPGQVFQSRPYVSPDTHDWVIGNATPIPLGAPRRSVRDRPLRAVRRELPAPCCAQTTAVERAATVVDARTGARRHRQLPPSAGRRARSASRATAASPPLARRPVEGRDRRSTGTSRPTGTWPPVAGNANDWILVATAPDHRTRTPGRHRRGAARACSPWPWCS